MLALRPLSVTLN